MAREKKNATIAALERTNPLSGLSIAAAKSIFDCARAGDTERLHWLYQEIEAQNAILSMAVSRRAGAAANFAWKVSERSAMDGSLSAEQKDAVEIFLSNIDNLSDLFEHLDLALFRGFAHAQPVWEGNSVKHIQLLDSWKFLKKDGVWLYNPDCNGFSSSCVDCTNARLVTVERRRPVDVPALAIHLRHAVGSRDWGRFIERYALPKPAVVMAPNAAKTDRADYLEAASCLENGQVTVWPSGASLMDFAGGSRGVDPFSNFIVHQEKTILMLATGGTLGSMAESGAGTLAGNAQADVWDQIVSRDAGVIAAAVKRSMVLPYLESAFPGHPCAVDFSFDLTKKPTPKEIFETAAAARSAGYLISQDELEEATGYKLEKANLGQGSGLPEAPSIPPSTVRNSQTLFKTPLGAFKTASNDSDGQPAPKTENALVEALEAMFEKSLAEAAAETMKGEDSAAPATSGAIANVQDANGAEHSDQNGQFVSKGEGSAREPETKPQHDRYGLNDIDRLAAEPEKNAARAKVALDEVVRKRGGYVDKAAYRPECGWIRLDWGDAGNPSDNFKGGHGLSHILAKHPEAAKSLPSILAKGEIYKHEEPGKLYILHENSFAVIGSLKKGGKKTITEFNSSHDQKKVAAIKNLPRAKVAGEN